MNKAKLRYILKAISPEATKVDFAPFDNEVQKLKDKLKEQVVVKTLEDVNVALEQNRKRINFQPLLSEFGNLKQEVENKHNIVLDAIASRQKEVSSLIENTIGKNTDRIDELQAEISLLKRQPDFAKLIKDSEKKLAKLIETAQTDDNEQDKKENLAIQAQFLEFEKQVKELKLHLRGGGSMNRRITFNGNNYLSRYTDINYKAGTNITFSATDNNTTKQADITITASGGGFTLLAATGTIDGANTSFTFAQQPTYIVSDHMWYRVNNGWTWNNSILTATMSVPPNDDIWGFV